jgi:hypothetical protein
MMVKAMLKIKNKAAATLHNTVSSTLLAYFVEVPIPSCMLYLITKTRISRIMIPPPAPNKPLMMPANNPRITPNILAFFLNSSISLYFLEELLIFSSTGARPFFPLIHKMTVDSIKKTLKELFRPISGTTEEHKLPI